MYQKSSRNKWYWGILIFLLLIIPVSLGVYFSQCCKNTNTTSVHAVADVVETATKKPAQHINSAVATNTPPASSTPLATIALTETPSPTVTLQPTPQAITVNDLQPDDFIHIPAKTMHHSIEILARGKAAGRNMNRFSKIGDSILDTTQFFTVFDNGRYQLGEYQYLENVIQHYPGVFGRFGVSAQNGWSAATALSPKWAPSEYCYAGETPLACEIRLNNPSLILIHFGTNDTDSYEYNMRRIIEYAIGKGVVPVLITKANRIDERNQRNELLYNLAEEYYIPLWDFDAVADTLPNRGLAEDNIHLNPAYDFDYSDSQNVVYGYEAFNLTGLMFLDAFMRDIVLYER